MDDIDNTGHQEIVSIRVLRNQAKRIERAWKRTDDCTNRSQFIRKAINTYAGEKIFEE